MSAILASESPAWTIYSVSSERSVGRAAGRLGVGVGPVGAGVSVGAGVGLGSVCVNVASPVGKVTVAEPCGTFQGS